MGQEAIAASRAEQRQWNYCNPIRAPVGLTAGRDDNRVGELLAQPVPQPEQMLR